MKFIYKQNNDETVIVSSKERTPLVDSIEELVLNSNLSIDGHNIYGYLENDIVPIKLEDIISFYSEDDKTFARVKDKTYLVKYRLYMLEEKLPNNFIRINKSRIINRYHIAKFDVSWTATILVVMDNNDKDYVSRRLVSKIKERMNLK